MMHLDEDSELMGEREREGGASASRWSYLTKLFFECPREETESSNVVRRTGPLPFGGAAGIGLITAIVRTGRFRLL